MSKSYPASPRLALQLAALATLVTIAPAGAATFTYTPAPGSGDLWSAGTNWDAAPVSAADTRLTFVADNATMLADGLGNANTDDISGEFSLNILDLQGTGPTAGGSSVIINAAAPATGLTLVTDLAAPVVNLNALAGGSGLTYQVNPVLTLAGDATITGAGTASFKFSGGVSGAGRTLSKTGASAMTLGGTSTLETLNVGFNNGAGGKITAEAGSSLSIGTGAGSVRIGASNASISTGALDLSAADSFTANVTELLVGVNFGGSNVNSEGTLNLAANNAITASANVSVGRSAGNFNTPLATGTVPDDSLTIVNTPVFTIGQGKSNGVFTAGSMRSSTWRVSVVRGRSSGWATTTRPAPATGAAARTSAMRSSGHPEFPFHRPEDDDLQRQCQRHRHLQRQRAKQLQPQQHRQPAGRRPGRCHHRRRRHRLPQHRPSRLHQFDHFHQQRRHHSGGQRWLERPSARGRHP